MRNVRLHLVVEGQTEEGFVKTILAPELGLHGIYADAHRITTGRNHSQVYRGGFVRYEHLAKDLTLWMKQDGGEDSWFTTMVDLYRLPKNFPGSSALPGNVTLLERVRHLESALIEDLQLRLASLPVCNRFVPYIQAHEFEALLFSEPGAFEEAFPGNVILTQALAAIREKFPTPEHINEDPAKAPSKRILSLAPNYQKPVAGLLIAQRIGLTKMRGECRHFDAWITRLLTLAEP